LNTIGSSSLYAKTDPEKIKVTLIAQAKNIIKQIEILLPMALYLLFPFIKDYLFTAAYLRFENSI
jgi:hypothetical protein